MEALLNREVDGRNRFLLHWYSLAHAARCRPCREFLEAIRENRAKLAQARSLEPSHELTKRLRSALAEAAKAAT
jgi:hypothetical protein